METSLPTPMTARVQLFIYWRVPPRFFFAKKDAKCFSSSVSRSLDWPSGNDHSLEATNGNWAASPLWAIPPSWAHRISCFWIWSCSQTPLPTTSHLSWSQVNSGCGDSDHSWVLKKKAVRLYGLERIRSCFFLSVGERGNAKQQLDWYFLDQRFAHCFSWFVVIYLCNYQVNKNWRRNQSGTQPRHQKYVKADWSHNHTRTSIAKASFR